MQDNLERHRPITVKIPDRAWLLKRVADAGGIAPEYGIAMLDKIEQLERHIAEA